MSPRDNLDSTKGNEDRFTVEATSNRGSSDESGRIDRSIDAPVLVLVSAIESLVREDARLDARPSRIARDAISPSDFVVLIFALFIVSPSCIYPRCERRDDCGRIIL